MYEGRWYILGGGIPLWLKARTQLFAVWGKGQMPPKELPMPDGSSVGDKRGNVVLLHLSWPLVGGKTSWGMNQNTHLPQSFPSSNVLVVLLAKPTWGRWESIAGRAGGTGKDTGETWALSKPISRSDFDPVVKRKHGQPKLWEQLMSGTWVKVKVGLFL